MTMVCIENNDIQIYFKAMFKGQILPAKALIFTQQISFELNDQLKTVYGKKRFTVNKCGACCGGLPASSYKLDKSELQTNELVLLSLESCCIVNMQ